MILCVDIGNTRVKWARIRNGVLGEQHAAVHDGWTVDQWRDALFRDGGIERVVASTVAGGTSADRLAQAALAATGQAVRFAATGSEAAGVVNGYTEPRLLGVDRWLAVVAAHHLAPDGCVVVDVGTAMTVDVVLAQGRHLGGYIVPGPELMIGSLMRGTSDLATHTATSPASKARGFADNTRDAIGHGCRLALAALVDRAVRDATPRAGHPVDLLLTGGALEEIRPRLATPGRVVGDLVVRGLARLVLAGEL